ncbi:hypothetical protein [Flagellimonas meridianipacifica]|uniref:hypothetical protein n=1 Tax=Flagellimonas meridianipacifica TaxID=1080225 RepID=UPI00130482AE|nr:hypothetical protein [Allomuricauda pacifica]
MKVVQIKNLKSIGWAAVFFSSPVSWCGVIGDRSGLFEGSFLSVNQSTIEQTSNI